MHYFNIGNGSVAAYDNPLDAPTGAAEITEAEYVAASIPQPSASDEIKRQILELESQQDARRIREAVLGIDNGWLANFDAQISILREKL